MRNRAGVPEKIVPHRQARTQGGSCIHVRKKNLILDKIVFSLARIAIRRKS